MDLASTIGWIEEHTLHIYVGFVLGVGLWALLRFSRTLRHVSRRRQALLEQRSLLDALPIRTPLEDPLEVAQGRGRDSIDKNFTVTRRLVIPLIVVVTAAAASVPLLSTVPATALSAVIAIVTVVLGVAARPLIENAMSGLVASHSQLINIGDTVRVEGKYGTVEDITITHTAIKLWDWQRLIVPNSRMLQQSFCNYSIFDRYLWTYVEFWVAYEADLDEVERLAVEIASSSEYFADYESPQLWIDELGREGIHCWLAAWADTPSDAWYLRNDVRRRLATGLREAGIEIHLHRLRVDQWEACLAR